MEITGYPKPTSPIQFMTADRFIHHPDLEQVKKRFRQGFTYFYVLYNYYLIEEEAYVFLGQDPMISSIPPCGLSEQRSRILEAAAWPMGTWLRIEGRQDESYEGDYDPDNGLWTAKDGTAGYKIHSIQVLLGYEMVESLVSIGVYLRDY